MFAKDTAEHFTIDGKALRSIVFALPFASVRLTRLRGRLICRAYVKDRDLRFLLRSLRTLSAESTPLYVESIGGSALFANIRRA